MATTRLHRTSPTTPPGAARPRPRRRIICGLLAITVLVAGLVAYRVIRTADVPDTVALDTVVPVAGTSGAVPSGRWTVAAGSSLSYRVTEPLDVTVVGRTEAVQGDLDIEVDGPELSLTGGTVRADLRELRSDATARDTALRGRILETEEFPEAVFTLQGPVDLGPLEPGEPTRVEVPGELTVRERTASESADLTARWDGAELRIVGSVDISLADYAVEVSRVAGVSTIDDDARIEVDLVIEPPA